MRHFINLEAWSSESLHNLLELAIRLKGETHRGVTHHHLSGKNVAMHFDKSSLRTRVSFEVGLNQLGANAIVLGSSAGQLGAREPVADYARVLTRYVDGLIVRTFAESGIEELAELGKVPVINALTDESHPCQSMADMLTLKEHWGSFENKTLVYIGDSNNVARSLLRACEKFGVAMKVISPKGYEFGYEERSKGEALGFEFLNDPVRGVKGADALYTDVWTSMGQEEEKRERLEAFQGFCIDETLLAKANPDCVVLHCLPAHRGEEISHEVMESKQSVVFDQAENRLHAQKAIMVELFSQNNQ
jgi:ornithine carbamoyltransferase